MTMTPVEPVPALRALPVTFPREGAIEIELEQGVLIFRVSTAVQERIEELLEKQHESTLSQDEHEELDQYEEVDDYLSFVNRLSRNIVQSQQG
jgi:hypothetical protein